MAQVCALSDGTAAEVMATGILRDCDVICAASGGEHTVPVAQVEVDHNYYTENLCTYVHTCTYEQV